MAARRLTLSALLAAVAVACLFLSVLIPQLDLTAVALAAIAVALSLEKNGVRYGVLTFVAAAILAWLMLPDKIPAMYFSVLLGPYPLLSYGLNKLPGKALPWIAKLGAEAALAVGCYLVFTWAFTDVEGPLWMLALMLALYLAVVVFYELAAARLVKLLAARIK